MDYDYLAQSLAALAGVPVRIYVEGTFERLYHHTRFEPDLAVTEEKNIFRGLGNVSYYMDENFLCYGLFRSARDRVALVMGPVSQVAVDRTLAVRILRAMGESVGRAGELADYFAAIPSYPLRNFLQILCTVNFFLNDEKLDVGQLLLAQEELPAAPPSPVAQAGEPREAHNTDELEAVMLSCVEHGRVDEIRRLFQRPVEGRAGTMAADALRQEKNLVICAATLVTRAAIRGGLDRAAAFSLSDAYIQRAELMGDYAGLMRLNAQMVEDFTRRVADARCGGGGRAPDSSRQGIYPAPPGRAHHHAGYLRRRGHEPHLPVQALSGGGGHDGESLYRGGEDGRGQAAAGGHKKDLGGDRRGPGVFLSELFSERIQKGRGGDAGGVSPKKQQVKKKAEN